VNFTTKDSGKREEFTSGMVRDTQEGKSNIALVYSGPMLERWAGVLTRGAVKYAVDNWMKANGEAELRRFRESAARHFFQWMNGQTDEDHAAAVFFNINGAEYVKERLKEERDCEAIERWSRPESEESECRACSKSLYVCSLKTGHKGPHEAWTGEPTDPSSKLCDTWPLPRPLPPHSGPTSPQGDGDDGETIIDGCLCDLCERRRTLRYR
jgi:Domain of unknown function (DUF5664)